MRASKALTFKEDVYLALCANTALSLWGRSETRAVKTSLHFSTNNKKLVNSGTVLRQMSFIVVVVAAVLAFVVVTVVVVVTIVVNRHQIS